MSKYAGKEWAVKSLPLPIDVMVTEYRQAKNPNRMIDILADQCGVNPCRIAWILDRCGMAVESRKMPRALRSEESFDYVTHWENSEDAVICDRLKKQIRDAQSMPEFDKQESGNVPELLKPYPVAGVDPSDKGCTDEREIYKMEVKEAFEKEDRIIERLEAAVAESEEEIKAADIRKDILTRAAVCVCTDRNSAYGEAEDNFAVIAEMWSAYLNAVLLRFGEIRLDGADVADMMVLFKVARNSTALERKADTYVDIAGYAACGGAIAEKVG